MRKNVAEMSLPPKEMPIVTLQNNVLDRLWRLGNKDADKVAAIIAAGVTKEVERLEGLL